MSNPTESPFPHDSSYWDPCGPPELQVLLDTSITLAAARHENFLRRMESAQERIDRHARVARTLRPAGRSE